MIPVMIDSGAYTAMTQGREIDLESYVRFLKKYLEQYPEYPLVYVNLDVIGDGEGSYENWMRMRIEGLSPIPVYHVNTDVKWLQKYLDKVDYIGVGAIARLSSEQRLVALDRIWERYLIDENRMPKVRVHGMGIAGFPLLKRYPWYSVDTTTWVLIAGYGGIYMPTRRRGQWRYDESPSKMFVSDTSPAVTDKGRHYKTLTELERGVVDEYLSSIGESITGEGGLAVSWHARARVNLRFFAGFVGGLSWPRAFTALRPGGLLV